jgi:hypothetical protein
MEHKIDLLSDAELDLISGGTLNMYTEAGAAFFTGLASTCGEAGGEMLEGSLTRAAQHR